MEQLMTPALCFLAYGIFFNSARYSAMAVADSSGVADNLLYFLVLIAKMAGLAFIAYRVWHFGWIGLLLAIVPILSALAFGLLTTTFASQVIIRKLSAVGLLMFGVMMFLAAK